MVDNKKKLWDSLISNSDERDDFSDDKLENRKSFIENHDSNDIDDSVFSFYEKDLNLLFPNHVSEMGNGKNTKESYYKCFKFSSVSDYFRETVRKHQKKIRGDFFQKNKELIRVLFFHDQTINDLIFLLKKEESKNSDYLSSIGKIKKSFKKKEDEFVSLSDKERFVVQKR